MTYPRAHARGGAVVETALGMLVMVTILMFGIFFSEVTTLGMKVTEAASAPIWDTTAGEMHRIEMWRFDPTAAIRAAETANNARYQNFDGVRTTGAPQWVFTTASGMRVRCGSDGWSPPVIGSGALSFHGQLLPSPLIPAVYRDNGGMWCEAEARVTPRRIPTSFADRADGIFVADHREGAALNSFIRVCAIGRPNGLNGPCAGPNGRSRFAMMIDDWGLTNQYRENVICPVLPWPVPCPNLGFWTASFRIFQLNGGGQGTAHVDLVRQTLNGATPPGLTTSASFYMSYMGEEPMLFMQPILPGDGTTPLWPTTPFAPSIPVGAASTASYLMRKGCYLGQECNSPSLDQP